jgi:hypothetical protein
MLKPVRIIFVDLQSAKVFGRASVVIDMRGGFGYVTVNQETGLATV